MQLNTWIRCFVYVDFVFMQAILYVNSNFPVEFRANFIHYGFTMQEISSPFTVKYFTKMVNV